MRASWSQFATLAALATLATLATLGGCGELVGDGSGNAGEGGTDGGATSADGTIQSPDACTAREGGSPCRRCKGDVACCASATDFTCGAVGTCDGGVEYRCLHDTDCGGTRRCCLVDTFALPDQCPATLAPGIARASDCVASCAPNAHLCDADGQCDGGRCVAAVVDHGIDLGVGVCF